MYFDWLKPEKTLVVDFTEVNKLMGKETDLHLDRFPGARVSDGYPEQADMDWLLDGVDIILTAETPYNHALFKLARERGVKTVLHYNFEFLGNLQDDLPFPDLLLAPSMWRADEVKELAEKNGARWDYLPLGVNREELPFRLRTKLETITHVVGIPAHNDRNGTQTLIDCLKYITKPVKVKFYSQSTLPQISAPRHVEIEVNEGGIEDYRQLYSDGDVLVFPRKYGGQSLVLQEAMSSGMGILMPDCEPQNQFLHQDSLLPSFSGTSIRAKAIIDIHEVKPHVLAARVDDLIMNPSKVETLSRRSDEIACDLDWRNLAPKYLELFEKLLET